MSTRTTPSTTNSLITNRRRGTIQRWTRTLIPTLREAPAEAVNPSHRLMLRAGCIRQVGAGVYEFLPLGMRVLQKVSQIVREEMDAAGSAEMLMPAIVPLELYSETKRDVEYGDLLFKLTDRHGRGAALGPTHEETVTEMAKGSVMSYKQLPLNVYQIQTKFRDEFRPRAGLLRCREFLMKDAYSFHLSIDGDGGLNETYDRMYQAYVNVFTRCGLDFTVVEAEAGPIGGSASHEFMVNAETGEDTIMVCPASGYAANVEKCEIGTRAWSFDSEASAELAKKHTPDMPGIDLVAEHLGINASRMLKTIVFQKVGGTKRKYVLAVVRGDHEVNEGKVRDSIGFPIELANEKEAIEAGFVIGYVSPRMVAHRDDTLLVIDPDATTGSWATGADEKDQHVTGYSWSRDLGADLPEQGKQGGRIRVADIRNAVAGDPSPRDASAKLEARRGIEVGHIFKLGTKYAKAFKFVILDKEQKKQTVIMGCYGIGVSRTVASSVEMSHDDSGIIWPTPIAPYHVIITVMDPSKDEHASVAADLSEKLADAGVDVLIDDRKERPGVKFKDADLIGIPIRITIGDKALAEDSVEFKLRTEDGKGRLVEMADVVQETISKLNATTD
ncbi:proline--tRNA ligase [Phycisphaeraceae bacterium AH-315-B13]|nr:proline--tRNA ligase [Phycisphaeraceae bacterium AH-315-B13]